MVFETDSQGRPVVWALTQDDGQPAEGPIVGLYRTSEAALDAAVALIRDVIEVDEIETDITDAQLREMARYERTPGEWTLDAELLLGYTSKFTCDSRVVLG